MSLPTSHKPAPITGLARVRRIDQRHRKTISLRSVSDALQHLPELPQGEATPKAFGLVRLAFDADYSLLRLRDAQVFQH